MTACASGRPPGMRWILIVPFVLACDRVRPPAKAERPPESVPVATPTAVVAIPLDTAAPVVMQAGVPDPTTGPAQDSVVAALPDSAAPGKPESAAVQPRLLVIPASLSRLPPDPENEPMSFDADGAPILPYVSYGDCEGVRCSTGFVALACVATTLRSAASLDAPAASRLPEGELVQVRRDLHIEEAGVVVVKQDFFLEWDETPTGEVARSDTVHLAEGDTVFVLRNPERARWTWAYLGRLHDSGEFWATVGRTGAKRMESELAVRRSLPRREQWWSVSRLDGTLGWWLQAVNGEPEETETHNELQSVTGARTGVDACARTRTRTSRTGGRGAQ